MLLDRLENLALNVRGEFPHINRGGCAVFAHLVVNELQRINIRAFGLVGGRCRVMSLDEAREEIEDTCQVLEWNIAGISFHHVGVGFRYGGTDYQFECHDGLVERDEDQLMGGWPVLEGCLSPEELEAIALDDDGGWNRAFDRSRIPELAGMIREHFVDLPIHEERRPMYENTILAWL